MAKKLPRRVLRDFFLCPFVALGSSRRHKAQQKATTLLCRYLEDAQESFWDVLNPDSPLPDLQRRVRSLLASTAVCSLTL